MFLCSNLGGIVGYLNFCLSGEKYENLEGAAEKHHGFKS